MASVRGPQFSILNRPSWVDGASVRVQHLASCGIWAGTPLTCYYERAHYGQDGQGKTDDVAKLEGHIEESG